MAPPEVVADAPFAPTGEVPGRASLRSLAMRGSAWTFLGFGASQALRLASHLVLSRLLFPEAFGLMALVGVFMSGLELFSDVGIGPSLIQNKRGDEPNFYNTAWTIQVLRGLALTVAAGLLAYPVAVGWFRKPELVPLMVAAGLVTAIAGFNSTKLFAANRHLAFGRLTALELGIQAATLALTIALAYALRSVWALVAANLAGAGLRMLSSHLALPGPGNRLRLDRGAARELFAFGRWIFLATAINFLASQGDRLILGRLLDDRALGVYSVAFLLADTPMRLIASLSQRVLFPAISRVHREDPTRVGEVYRKARWRLDPLGLVPLGLVVGLAPDLVALLLDRRYAGAGPMLRALAVRAAIGCSLAPAASALMAIGRPQYATIGVALRFAWLLAAIPLLWARFGVAGAVWAVGLSELPTMVVVLWGARSRGLLGARVETRALLLAASGAGAGFAAHAALFRWGGLAR